MAERRAFILVTQVGVSVHLHADQLILRCHTGQAAGHAGRDGMLAAEWYQYLRLRSRFTDSCAAVRVFPSEYALDHVGDGLDHLLGPAMHQGHGVHGVHAVLHGRLVAELVIEQLHLSRGGNDRRRAVAGVGPVGGRRLVGNRQHPGLGPLRRGEVVRHAQEVPR